MIWAAFVLEYGIRLYLAPNKRYFVSHNVIDLLFVSDPRSYVLFGWSLLPAPSLYPRNTGAVVLLRAVDAGSRRSEATHELGYTLLIALVVVVGSGMLREAGH